jgi:23S rRNA pseudouridine2604 synthase
MVDGAIVTEVVTLVDPSQVVELTHQGKKEQNESVTIILNKPIGYVSAQPEANYIPAIRLITPENQELINTGTRLKDEHFDGLAVAGRLDIDSQGLLIFTQDGRLAKRIIGEDSEIEKEYLVRVRGDLSESDLELLRYGLEMDGAKLRPAHVEWVNEDQLRFVLKEGKKRQIRRMCEMVGLEIHGLKRVRVGKLMLGPLPEGKWRFLRPGETV